ncbi:MAG TPA: hypothetical protein VH041_06755 [Caldimonas sp.]|nr:hypothetical protein [Caldimonas sp.]HEX4233989.1 hypothetical protein [Caldimonas sp.]
MPHNSPRPKRRGAWFNFADGQYGIVAIVLGLAATSIALAQSPSTEAPARHVIVRVGRLLDVRSGTYLTNVAIAIDGERIRAVGPADDVVKAAPADARVIELGGADRASGPDRHTHLLARTPDARYGYEINLLTKSQAYRALEGAANARATIEAGFTSARRRERGLGLRRCRPARRHPRGSG